MNQKYWVSLFVFAIIVSSDAMADAQNGQVVNNTKDSPSSEPSSPEYQPTLKLGAFGTFGVLHSNQSSGDYVLEGSMPSGAGRSNEWDINNYSKVGLQLNGSFSPKTSAQLQIITAYDSSGIYQPDIEWLNFKYSITQNAYVRVGRIGLPTYFDSGNHDIGYTYTWAHPPSELYYLLSIQSSDGIDGMYRINIGEAQHSFKAFYGQNSSDGRAITTSSTGMWGIFDIVEYGQTAFHAGYQKRNTTTQVIATGVTNPAIDCTDLSFGVNYDPGNWFITSEWVQSQTRYTANAFYVGAGYRINKFTPFLVHSQNTSGSFPQGFTPTATESILASRSQETNSIGLRWDFRKHFDIKAQFDQVTLSNNSNGYLINVPANTTLYGSTVNLLSAVVDFVY